MSQALDQFNLELVMDHVEETFSALKELLRLVDSSNAFMFKAYAEKYFHGLKQEQKEGIPSSVLVCMYS